MNEHLLKTMELTTTYSQPITDHFASISTFEGSKEVLAMIGTFYGTRRAIRGLKWVYSHSKPKKTEGIA